MVYHPQILFGDLLITEPVTAGTDVVLCVLSFFLASKVRTKLHLSFFNDDWRLFFLFIGLSTGIGSIAHGLTHYFSPQLANAIWMSMNLCAGISVYYALRATIRYIRVDKNHSKPLHVANFLLLGVFGFLTLLRNDFEIFKIHALVGVLAIFITFSMAWIKKPKGNSSAMLAGSGAVMLAFGLSIMTVLIHTMQLSISVWFNYKDISHVVMMISLLLVYRGMQLMSGSLKLSLRRT